MRQVCDKIYGKKYSKLSTEEKVQFSRYSRMVQYYLRHDKNKLVMREYKRQRKILVIALSGHNAHCYRCGYDKYIGALDFHHTNTDEKDFDVVSKGTLEEQIAEAKKCEIICSNCHREEHDGDKSKAGRPQEVLKDPLFLRYWECYQAQRTQLKNI